MFRVASSEVTQRSVFYFLAWPYWEEIEVPAEVRTGESISQGAERPGCESNPVVDIEHVTPLLQASVSLSIKGI